MFIEDLDTLIIQIEGLNNENSVEEEINNLNQRFSQIKNIKDDLKPLLEDLKIIEGNIINFDPASKEQFKSVIENLQNVSEKFDGTAQSLVRGQHWNTILNTSELIKQNLNNRKNDKWNEFKYELNIQTYEAIKTLYNNNPINEKNIEKYKEKYQEYLGKSEQPPNNDKLKKEIIDLSNELKNFSFENLENLPDDVEIFLNSIKDNGSAELDLLTQDVTDWLRENGLLDNYNIIVR